MPEEEEIHQAHDKLFKAGFSDPANAAALLQAELPEAVAAAIDWAGLRLEPGSFVDSQFRHSESDLLFSASLAGKKSLIYVLFEHQTTSDPVLALRLLRYMARIWEARCKEGPQTVPLPLILPVVLAQNAEAWRIEPRLSALLDVPVELAEHFRPFVPDFSFRLLQLAEMPFEAIRGTPAGILILRTMKAERVARLLDDAVWDESLLVQIPRDLYERLLRYIVAADVDTEAFEHKIRDIKNIEIRDRVMTLAQKLHQKGRQEGRLEGRLEGIIKKGQESVLEALKLRFDDVPGGLREEVLAVEDEAKLRILFEAAIKSASLEEFAKSL